MQLARPQRSSPTYNVLVVALASALAAGAVLLVLTTASPRAGARFELSAGEAIDCPFEGGSPVCYRFTMSNTGGGSADVQCLVAAAGDSTAVFVNGETVYESAAAIERGASVSLYTKVNAGPSKVIDGPPVVSCAPST